MKLTTTMKDIRAADPCEDGWEKLLEHMGKTRTDAKHDETEFSLAVVLESNGIGDALWVLDNVLQNRRICSLFAADCAESVLHIFEAAYPNDDRPRKAIAVARNPNATSEDREAAWGGTRAAWAAAWAAGDAARDAARAARAAWDARAAWTAGDAARTAWAAARSARAAGDAAWAARAAPRAAWAARDARAAWAARDAARTAWEVAAVAAGAERAAAIAAWESAMARRDDARAARAARSARAAGEVATVAAWNAQSKRLAQYIEHGEAAAKMPWPEMEEA